MLRRIVGRAVMATAFLLWPPVWLPAAEPGAPAEDGQMAAVVLRAFREVHDGWSADEVLVRDDLQAAFLQRCRQDLPDAVAGDLNWTLLTLRKSGRLDAKATRRAGGSDELCRHAAEIAARFLYDKHRLSVDRILCDGPRRQEFDQLAGKIAPGAAADDLRRAALALRKSRQLRPELVTRVAEWDRQVLAWDAARLRADTTLAPAGPGVYLFRDATGYLYIGEAANLRRRLAEHLDQSDRQSLAHYLNSQGIDHVTVEVHAFDPQSGAKSKEMRRAYESELIRSRQPRFNVAP